MQEIESGALVIEGDTEVLRSWFSTRFDNPEAVALENAVRAITL